VKATISLEKNPVLKRKDSG